VLSMTMEATVVVDGANLVQKMTPKRVFSVSDPCCLRGVAIYRTVTIQFLL